NGQAYFARFSSSTNFSLVRTIPSLIPSQEGTTLTSAPSATAQPAPCLRTSVLLPRAAWQATCESIRGRLPDKPVRCPRGETHLSGREWLAEPTRSSLLVVKPSRRRASRIPGRRRAGCTAG